VLGANLQEELLGRRRDIIVEKIMIIQKKCCGRGIIIHCSVGVNLQKFDGS